MSLEPLEVTSSSMPATMQQQRVREDVRRALDAFIRQRRATSLRSATDEVVHRKLHENWDPPKTSSSGHNAPKQIDSPTQPTGFVSNFQQETTLVNQKKKPLANGVWVPPRPLSYILAVGGNENSQLGLEDHLGYENTDKHKQMHIPAFSDKRKRVGQEQYRDHDGSLSRKLTSRDSNVSTNSSSNSSTDFDFHSSTQKPVKPRKKKSLYLRAKERLRISLNLHSPPLVPQAGVKENQREAQTHVVNAASTHHSVPGKSQENSKGKRSHIRHSNKHHHHPDVAVYDDSAGSKATTLERFMNTFRRVPASTSAKFKGDLNTNLEQSGADSKLKQGASSHSSKSHSAAEAKNSKPRGSALPDGNGDAFLKLPKYVVTDGDEGATAPLPPPGKELPASLDQSLGRPIEAGKDAVYERVAQKLVEIADKCIVSEREADPIKESHTCLSSKVVQNSVTLEMEIARALRIKADTYAQDSAFPSAAIQVMIGDSTYSEFRRVLDEVVPLTQPEAQQLALVFRLTEAAVNLVGSSGALAVRIKENSLQYIEDCLARWIYQEGGWDSMIEESDFDVD